MSQMPGSTPPDPEPDAPLPQQREPNQLGVAGFIVSLVGPCTVGLLSLVGLVMSAIAMRRQPRGFATAGVVCGALGCIVIGVLFFWYASTLGLRVTQLWTLGRTIDQVALASAPIDAYHEQNDALPDDSTGQSLVDGRQDAWNTQIRYHKLSDTHYELHSAGPDGEFDTGDDLPVRSKPGLWADRAESLQATDTPDESSSEPADTQPAATQSGAAQTASTQAGATTRPTNSQSAALLHVSEVAGKPSADIDALFGQPLRVTPIERASNLMPGEYRSYRLRDGVTARFRFYRGEAAAVTLPLHDNPAPSAIDAIQLVGLDESGLHLAFQTPSDSPLTFRVKKYVVENVDADVKEVSVTERERGQWGLVVVTFNGYPN